MTNSIRWIKCIYVILVSDLTGVLYTPSISFIPVLWCTASIIFSNSDTPLLCLMVPPRTQCINYCLLSIQSAMYKRRYILPLTLTRVTRTWSRECTKQPCLKEQVSTWLGWIADWSFRTSKILNQSSNLVLICSKFTLEHILKLFGLFPQICRGRSRFWNLRILHFWEDGTNRVWSGKSICLILLHSFEKNTI